ncbi:MAG: thrombospondin type 3 repeat-containing protein [Chromatiaceae bacterium]|nr:thrombospondin type 3 repeat-containing protein [Chromatiaceae bacterium]
MKSNVIGYISRILAILSLFTVSLSFSATFPSTHPPGATTATWSDLGASANLYVWRDGTKVWVKIEPVIGFPFVCSPTISVVQNGTQLSGDPLLLRSDNTYFCGELYVTEIFRLVELGNNSPPFTDFVLDPSPFTLFYRHVSGKIDFLDVPAYGDAPIDGDNDGIPDASDNCPTVSNADQKDTDNDDQGDACDTEWNCVVDSDADGDGVIDALDSCPNTPDNSLVDSTGCAGKPKVIIIPLN